MEASSLADDDEMTCQYYNWNELCDRYGHVILTAETATKVPFLSFMSIMSVNSLKWLRIAPVLISQMLGQRGECYPVG